MTRAVTNALRERFERLPSRRGKASMEELRAIAKRAAAHVKRPYLDHAEFLYDETASLTRKTFDSLDEYFAEYAVLPDSPRLFRFRANTCWSPR